MAVVVLVEEKNKRRDLKDFELIKARSEGEMSFKSIVRELREMKDGMGSISKRRVEGKHWCNRTRSHIAPDVAPSEPVEQGKWANLPPELLLDIIQRVEESETTWPARTDVVFCASVGCTKGDDAGLSNAHMIMAEIPNASEAVDVVWGNIIDVRE
ncbi:hypothetical protein HYC85_019060 [Camellia sinensis]|uniref:Uncharacterized protein n=1 Tax=Camellia sinensis TaxID=4442 RepID=A0A7J7GPU1_CAMSI|nr:hypothetical protein HYC85_019060 [Camellia sinensis]